MAQRDIAVQPGETPVTAALRRYAALMGWAVTATTNGAHSTRSYHWTGRAVDLAARDGPGWDSYQLLQINEQIVQTIPLSMIRELIYAGPGHVCVQNGRLVNGPATYGPDVMARHHDHVHLAVVEDFTYNGDEPMPDNPDIPNASAPIVAAFPTPTGKGYTLVAADGAVYAFGDAGYYGRVEHLDEG